MPINPIAATTVQHHTLMARPTYILSPLGPDMALRTQCCNDSAVAVAP
jgi:hypothetical protein